MGEPPLIEFVTSSLPKRPLSLVLGNLDGIHLGHQFLLRKAKTLAEQNQCEPGLLRLHPHPRVFFKTARDPGLIQNQEQTIDLLTYYGIPHLLSFPFNYRTSSLSPEAFLDQIIQDLEVRFLIVGGNYRFGHKRAGTPHLLRTLAAKRGIEAHISDHIEDEDGVISSTRVRNCVRRGEMRKAHQLLGRHYFMEGPVIEGIQKGREMGIPTANMEPSGLLLPRLGVYATWLRARDQWLPSITNVGVRPTRNQDAPETLQPTLGIETHALDQTVELYGEHVIVAFTQFMRPEKRFEDFQALKAQIRNDIDQRRTLDDLMNHPDLTLFDHIAENRLKQIN